MVLSHKVVRCAASWAAYRHAGNRLTSNFYLASYLPRWNPPSVPLFHRTSGSMLIFSLLGSPRFGTTAAFAPVAVFRSLDPLGAHEIAEAHLPTRDACLGFTGTAESTAQAFVGERHVVPLLGRSAVCCFVYPARVHRVRLRSPELGCSLGRRALRVHPLDER